MAIAIVIAIASRRNSLPGKSFRRIACVVLSPHEREATLCEKPTKEMRLGLVADRNRSNPTERMNA